MLQILNDEGYIMIADLSRNFENVDNGIRFLQSDGGNPDFVELCHELDVFLKPEYRGREISKKLMAQLESVAKAKGYRYLILESGAPLVAAMALHKKIGYVTIPNYDPYIDVPDSICMKKEL